MERKKFKVNIINGGTCNVRIDSYSFWLAPHCGPGTLNTDDLCPFCGLCMGTCAHLNTASIRDRHKQQCGGSGLWCPACGLFWAQNACGENYNEELRNADPDLKLRLINKQVHCACGAFLFNQEDTETLGNEEE